MLKKKLLLQGWLHNEEEPRRLRGSIDKISEGDRIFFRNIAQPEISNKECVIGAPVIYHFASTQLTSFPLFDLEFNVLCHMIVAKVKGASPYLALSKKVNPLHYKNLCADDDFKNLEEGYYPKNLYVRKHGANMHDWMHFHYNCSIKDANGTKIFSENDVKNFSYSLYVAKDEHKALEFERYPNGRFSMYATVFVPLKHVQEIKHVRASSLPPSFTNRLREGEEVVSDELLEPKMTLEPITDTDDKAQEKPELESPEDNSSAQIFSLPNMRNITTANALPTATFIQPTDALSAAMQNAQTVHAKKEKTSIIEPLEPSKPTISSDTKTSIPCNLHIASKLIDEALRNDMRVADVVRKVLGLDSIVKDHLHFDLQLSDRDYAVLAKRFDINEHDKDTLHRLIMEEVSDFVGEPIL